MNIFFIGGNSSIGIIFKHIWKYAVFFAFVIFTFFSVIPQTDAMWFDSDFEFCRSMTMDSSQIATTTTNGFALVATSTITDLRATSSSGKVEIVMSDTPLDIIFTSGTDCNTGGGSLIDFYFEKYASTTGEFTVWVEPTDVSSTTDKTILMYYGNSSAIDQSNESGVFGASGESGVWDLSEDPSGSAPQMLDSTSNANHGTTSGAMTASDQVAGQLGGALDFEGTNDYVDTDYIGLSTSVYSISTWVEPDSTSGTVGLVAFGPYESLFMFNGASVAIQTNGHNSGDNPSTVIPVNTWSHVVGIYDDNNNLYQIYINGVLERELATTDDSTGRNGMVIGARITAGVNDHFNGSIDDVRIYNNRALTASDILTIYNNTSLPTFWTFGVEETEDTGGPSIGGKPTWYQKGDTFIKGKAFVK